MLDDLVLTPVIREIVSHPARFKVLTTGRRWGKDRCGMIWLHHGELLPGRLYWYVAPYRKQAKAIAWPLLKTIARAYGVGRDAISESELSVTWPNGAKTELKGADNPDSLLGVGIERCLCTEYARWKPGIWEQILRPMLTQSKGSVMFNSSPRGFDKHYNLHKRGIDEEFNEWMSWVFKTKDSPFVDEAEVESARADMDPFLFRQEYEASFESFGNRAAYAFDRDIHVKERELSGKKFVGLDFNVDTMAAVLYCEYPDTTVHAFDEVVLRDTNTLEMAQYLRRKYPEIKDIYPDPAGKARSTTSRQTDHQILREAGFYVYARTAHPSQVDRLNAFNRKLMNAKGEIGLTIAPKCKNFINDLEMVMRTPDGRIDKSDPKLTHYLDAGSYCIEILWPMVGTINVRGNFR